MTDSIDEITSLIDQARVEGKPVQFGERECSFCGADLGESWPTLRVQTPEITALVRLCSPCARRFDVEEGMFQKIAKG